MASLNLTSSPSSGKTLKLSTLGTSDWLAYNSSKTLIRKSGGSAKIGIAHIGSFTDDVANDSTATINWTDGDVVASGSATSLVFGAGNGLGYSITAPADTNLRTMYVCAGVYSGTLTATATISDGTGGTKTATVTWVSGSGLENLFVIDYSAASAGQTLTVTFVQSAPQGGYSNCGIQAVALSAPITVGGRNLTMTSAAYNASGKFGASLSSGYGLASNVLSGRRISVAGWIKTSAASGAPNVAFGQGNVLWVGMDSSGYATAHYGGGSSSTDVGLTTTTKVNDNVSHYAELCVDFDAGAYLFIDGALVASSTTASTPGFADANNTFGIGIFPYGPSTAMNYGFPWVGEIDDVAVYNGMRHIAAYTASVPSAAASTTDPNLIALYSLNSNGNDTAGVTGSTAPNAPTIGAVTAGTNSVTAAFTAPSSGTTPTSYTAVWSGGGSATGTTSPLTITGLTAGTAGTVHVYASAGGLNSANSAESGSVTPTAPAASNVTIPFTDSAIFWSPYNWDTLGTYKQSNNAGAYCKFGFTGTSLAVNFDVSALAAASSTVSASSWPIVRIVIDGTSATDQQITSSGTITISSLTNASHTVELHYLATDDNNGDQWNTPVQAVRIKSFVLNAGATYSAPTLRAKRHLHFGDSISRGYMAKGTDKVQPASNDSQLTVPPSLAKMFGAELGVVAFSGQGYEQTGNGNVVPVLTAWNQYSSGRSQLPHRRRTT
jgi:hypothetical protein